MRRAALGLLLVACSAKPYVTGGPRAQPVTAPRSVCGPSLPVGEPAKALPLIQASHGATVTHLEASADGYLATYSQFDHTIRIWDLDKQVLLALRQEDAEFGWDDAAHGLVLIGRGKQPHNFVNDDLVIGVDGGALGERVGSLSARTVTEGARHLWHAFEEQDKEYTFRDGAGVVHHLVKPGYAYLENIALVANGGELVAYSTSQLLRWSLAQPASKPVETKLANVESIAIAPNGDAVVVEKNDQTFTWQVSILPRDGSAKRPIASGDDLGTPEIATDGVRIVVSTDELIATYDYATGKQIWGERGAAFDDKRDRVATSGFGTALIVGTKLVVARDDGSISLRDLATGRPLGSLGTSVHQPALVRWIDATHVLSVDQGRAAVWDVPSGTIVGAYTEPRGFLGAAVVGTDVVVARETNCFDPKTYKAKTIAWVDRWTGFSPPAGLLEGKAPALRTGCDHSGTSAWPPARGLAAAPVELAGAGEGFDVASGNSLTKDGVRHPDGSVIKLQGFRPVVGLDVTLRGTTVAAPVRVGKDSGIGVWSAVDGSHLHDFTVTTHVEPLGDLTGGSLVGLSDDGARIAVTANGHVIVFDVASGDKLVDAQLKNWPTTVAFGADKKDAWISTELGELHHYAPDGSDTVIDVGIGLRVEKLAISPAADRVIAVGGDGGLRVVDVKAKRLAATLVEFGDDEPLAFTPAGAYAGTSEAASRVAWRFGAPLEVFPFEQFAERFHKPDVVRARLAGSGDDVTGGLVRPPHVLLAAPAATVATPEVDLAISVETPRRIDSVRAYREGREVARSSPCRGTTNVKLRVPLLAGTNTITVQAFDDLGYASNPAVARVARTAGAHPELYIVAVGVGTYPNLDKKDQLALATADATGIAAAFDGEKGNAFADIHKQVLLDGSASPAAVANALDSLSAMRPDDLAIVFFAGHGIKPSADADMVFVTGNATLTPAGIAANSVAWTAVSEKLARARGRVVVLLDACHAGHIHQDLVVPNDRLANALAHDGRAGVIVFAAAKGRQESLEPGGGTRGFAVKETVKPLLPRGDHAVFTGSLLAALHDKQTDRDGDGVIEMSEWIAATTERVTRVTEGLQTPWVARQEMFGDFSVAPLR